MCTAWWRTTAELSRSLDQGSSHGKRPVQNTGVLSLPIQLVALAACSMTSATVLGSEIMDRCPAFTSVMRAPARSAMNVSSAGGVHWSAGPITAHDGLVSHAGGTEG